MTQSEFLAAHEGGREGGAVLAERRVLVAVRGCICWTPRARPGRLRSKPEPYAFTGPPDGYVYAPGMRPPAPISPGRRAVVIPRLYLRPAAGWLWAYP